eukprot:NODE_1631_length_1272_cov_64.027074_g1616_i0.p2 GENE.NODE_1631_length_1272_cov_64.027074_g1616_i0~~NODE_1631_length_1272_cov_64.027074_g1616_i0.p2  ORF type:complete len:241 (+),score=88.42 NODE_1631_length_1272_cov_64.027074_g1616_i0:372-1094(+)
MEGDSDSTYKNILVIGARKVGKTSILAAAISGDFSEDYAATNRVDHYYDCERNLHLIDTPGVNFDVLDRNFTSFKADPMIKEYIGQQEENKVEYLKDVDASTFIAYVIVHSEQSESAMMAQALREVIRRNESTSDILLYMVKNTGDIDTDDGVWDLRKKQAMARHVGDDAEKQQSLFEDMTPTPDDAYTKYKTVCARTMSGLSDFLNELHEKVEQDYQSNRRRIRKVIPKRGCSTNCVVQ